MSETNIKNWSVYDKQTKNMPNECYIAVRDFIYFNNNWIILKLTELHPQIGRIWYRHYDKSNGKWTETWTTPLL